MESLAENKKICRSEIHSVPNKLSSCMIPEMLLNILSSFLSFLVLSSFLCRVVSNIM